MAEELTLFSVTLDWGTPGSDEGDYSTWVWATDNHAAIRMVAEEMANSDEKEFDSDAERDAYIETVIESARPFAAMVVFASLGPEIEILMKGPTGEWKPEAQKDYDTVKAILAKYGVGS